MSGADLGAIEARAARRAQLRRHAIVSYSPGVAFDESGNVVIVERDRTVTEYAGETPPADADLALVIADARAHRTRADAAEAEVARLRGAREVVLPLQRDHLREQRDTARAEVASLRAIVEGRTVAPTDAEIAEHAAAGGRWLVALVSLRSGVTPCEVVRLERRSPIADAVDRWIALDATGRPCSWPTGGGR